ncbi:response regulator transcription factor [Pedococcus sp. KACC 23699]|uniref:Response regulator transcription factor n=1 Tax=Pedococcus sp. KACC 23699 TaxID=3149228 RepID=A0AAU7JRH0_9MICO
MSEQQTQGNGPAREPATSQDVAGPSGPTTVVVADDHPLWRDAVARDLVEAGMTLLATADDGPSAVHRTKATRPDVLVLDLNLPGMQGHEVCAALGSLPTRVLVLSASGEQQDVLAAVKAGATGYLVKSATREEIVAAVEATARGEAVFTAGLAGLVLGEFRKMSTQPQADPSRPIPELTERETEVLKLVATGMSYKEIASELFISHRTVQNHVQNTLGKLQLHNRIALVRFAIAKGLDTPTA